MPVPVLSGLELERRPGEAFPEAFNPGSGLSVQEVWYGGARMRLAYTPNTLRPGGTISGPTLMMLADVSIYVALLASIGWEPLAVTTNLNINFLKKTRAGDAVVRMPSDQAWPQARCRRGGHPGGG